MTRLHRSVRSFVCTCAILLIPQLALAQLGSFESFSPASGPTAGGYQMRVDGSIGFPMQNAVIRIGSAPCPKMTSGSDFLGLAQWQVCRVPAGVGANLVVTADGVPADSGRFSYSPPSIASRTPTAANVSGGALLALAGSNFGVAPASTQVRVGLSLCNIVTMSHTNITCVLPPMPAGGVPISVAAGGQVSAAVPFTYFSCAAGTFVSGNACQPCPAGSFSSGPNQTACVPAQPGFFVPTPGSTSQITCAPGTYTSSPGQIGCRLAPAGSYVPGSAATGSILCPAGTYSSALGATSCAAAPPGTFVGVVGAMAATLCPAGSFQPAAGQTQCTACAVGYGSNPGAVACFPLLASCAPGSYNTEPGICGPCAPGSWSPGGMVDACIPVNCSPAHVVDSSTGACVCPAPPPGQFISDPTTCALSAFPPSVALSAVCVAPDPADPTQSLVRFGYENRFDNGGAPLTLGYGSQNMLTVDGADAGVMSGVPLTLEHGMHTNAFTFRYTPGENVVWTVLDPQTFQPVTASPGSGTPSCVVQGPEGPQGPDGIQGPAGPQGPQGLTGATGSIGPTGPMGPMGPMGVPGPQGEKGDKGDPATLPPGTIIMLLETDEPPAGFTYIGSFTQRFARERGVTTERSVVIKMYRKN